MEKYRSGKIFFAQQQAWVTEQNQIEEKKMTMTEKDNAEV